MNKLFYIAATPLALMGCVEEAPYVGSSMPTIGSSTDVTAFEGVGAGQGEGGLQALGYEAIRTQGLTTWWFNRETGACARIRTSDGRYAVVTMLPAGDC